MYTHLGGGCCDILLLRLTSHRHHHFSSYSPQFSNSGLVLDLYFFSIFTLCLSQPAGLAQHLVRKNPTYATCA